MTIARYGVLRGRAEKKADATKRSPHYQVLLDAKQPNRIAVNVLSTDQPKEVLYFIDNDFDHEITRKLADLVVGFTPVASAPGGIALDYVRGQMFETWKMRPLPMLSNGSGTNDMNDMLDAAITRAIGDAEAELFAFGQRFEDKQPDQIFKFKPGRGIHDIHMNQGNGRDHANENGAWQDGGLFVHFPEADRWIAVFIAFQSQSFKTDAAGNALGEPTGPRAKQHRRDRKKHPQAPLGISLSPMGVVEHAPRRAPGEWFVSTELAPPVRRSLRAYAFDPSRGRVLGNEMQLAVQFRKLAPGPVEVDESCNDRIAVIDYDGTTRHYYHPVDLDDSRILLQGGLWPSESDPRFHQQMVYAVARETIEHFESALGRKVHWRRTARDDQHAHGMQDGDILTLNLYPHAMRAANAYYSPDDHGVLFGYFAADATNTEISLPNQPIFTCLSHDVIVHEMTHAIVDGQRGFLIEATNRDVAAFHEGFADLSALFRHFSHRDVLLDTLQRTGGRLYDYQLRPDATSDGGARPVELSDQLARPNPLIELAQQFGDATGLRKALRSALGSKPTPTDYKTVTEPHARGSILVAAVFDAFFSIYVQRTSDLFRIFRAGGGSPQPVDLPGPLANQLCAVANRTAEEFFALCVRSLDYCPPVDLTFGEFLRAMITSEVDRDHDDPDGIREALMQAFRLRGIYPDGARFFSEEALCWTRGADLELPHLAGLHFGDPNALTAPDRARIAPVLYGYVEDPLVRHRLGLDPSLPIDMPSFHPVYRTHSDGSLRRDMVVEVVQTRQVAFARGSSSNYPFRAGATLLIEPERDAGSPTGAKVRWVVTKPMYDPSASPSSEASERHHRQTAFLSNRGLTGDIATQHLHVDFAAIHGGMDHGD